MKKVLLSLLAILVVLGLFAAAGYAGYRFGYAQGVQTAVNGNTTRTQPGLRPFNGFGPNRMPMYRFGFGRDFRRGGFPMMGFGFFPPVMFLGGIVVLALVVGFVYWLGTRSGGRLTRQPVETRQPAEAPLPTESSSSEPENK
jgi:uncharacterized membrane protein